ncbi:flagellar biosynthetic protein FliR [Alicyclobacillus vulcanalis]|uniref:Flagellar biosynthetic protein FliR n=1 Tax=Alicyclobacillus vulcanalis TaxID=252246 RepID=A0A1N7MWD4_9BACL|nr:flagellar biosynthetic protein FliR [Alicyclobacillus vulcanalis]SIS90390.1 flagellar biosynthetic protein FliR [Alicyclobacillus vulcanalis]
MVNDVLSHFNLFLLMAARTSGFVLAAPIFSSVYWPNAAKVALAMALAAFAVPSMHAPVPDLVAQPGAFVVDFALEAVIGVVLGFVATWVFNTMNIAGQLVDLQIGMAVAELAMPGFSGAAGVFSNVYNVWFSILFIGMGGLEGLSVAVLESFRLIPIADWHLPSNWLVICAQTMDTVMLMAVDVALPVFASLFLCDVTFALLARAVPQMNAFVVELPAKLFVGLASFAVAMPVTVGLFRQLMNLVFLNMQTVMRLVGG